MIYLASPYSGAPDEMQHRYEQVRDVAFELIKHGCYVFSPIVYCHNPAQEINLPKDAEFWSNMNNFFQRQATHLWIVNLDGWDTSKGVRAEVEFAKAMGQKYSLISKEGFFVSPPEAPVWFTS